MKWLVVFGAGLFSMLAYAIDPARPPVDPGRLTGTYELEQSLRGICEKRIQVVKWTSLAGEDTISIGGWFFPRINQGSWMRHADYEEAQLETRLNREGELVHEARIYNKSRRQQELRRWLAKFDEDGAVVLHMTARPFEEFPLTCRYVRVHRD
jgi:hypothetical protein